MQVSDGYHKGVKPVAVAIWRVQLGIDHCMCGYIAKVTNPALGGLIVWSVQHKFLGNYVLRDESPYELNRVNGSGTGTL